MFAKFIFISLFALTAKAQIGSLYSYSGAGCPQGSISSTTTDDGSIISVLFDSFTTQTLAEKRYALSQCLLNITVNIPEGYRISTAQAVQNGFYSVPQGSWGRMMTEIYVRGKNSSVVMQTYGYRDFSDDFQENVTLETKATSRNGTDCSERQQILQVRSSIILWTAPQQTQFASGVIDSIDLTLSAATPSMYSVIFEKCPVKSPRRPRFPWFRHFWK